MSKVFDNQHAYELMQENGDYETILNDFIDGKDKVVRKEVLYIVNLRRSSFLCSIEVVLTNTV